MMEEGLNRNDHSRSLINQLSEENIITTPMGSERAATLAVLQKNPLEKAKTNFLATIAK